MSESKIKFSELRDPNNNIVLSPDTIVTLDSPSELDDFVDFITAGLQEELKQHPYALYKGGVFRMRNKSASAYFLESPKVKKLRGFPYRGRLDNVQILLLPPDTSFIKKQEGIIPETVTTFSVHADALSKSSTVIGDASRAYTLYLRTRRHGDRQKESANYLMMASEETSTRGIGQFLDTQDQGWLENWRNLISRRIRHPFSGGLMSLGKRS